MNEAPRPRISRRDWLHLAAGALAGGGIVSATFPVPPIVEKHPEAPAPELPRKD